MLTLLLFALFQFIAFQSTALASPLAENSISLRIDNKKQYPDPDVIDSSSGGGDGTERIKKRQTDYPGSCDVHLT